MEGVGDAFVHVVGQVIVEPGADVLVDGFQFDEDQRQAIDEAHEVGAAVVIGRAQAGQLQLAHGEEAVGAWLVVKVDHPGAGVVLLAGGVAPADGDAIADQPGEILIVLHQRAAEVMGGEGPHGHVDGC